MTSPPRATLATYPLHDGGGLPLVLLHGFPLDHRMWAACAQHLPAGTRAIGVDLPGAGHSDLDGSPPSIEHAADLVYRAMVAEGEGNAVVVGHSMGGYVALALAERHPGFVAGLGLVSTKSTADTDEARAKRLRVAAATDDSQTVDAVLGMPAALVGATSTEHRRHLFPSLDAWIRAQSPASVAWAQRAMAARPDRTAVLERFSAPVAVVVGAEDTVTPLAEAEHMVRAAAGSAPGTAAGNAALTVVPGVGHLSPVEDPQAVAAALGLLHNQVVAHH
ncbi:alpha/beta fold hydrolase [Promicromonospora thailandica]|uniref:Pimeloyl-ACP methyl ester carboxylesterase n=1 Tax=Promicromonospora thailandica TaxID=765201 RepID=A0A9X2G5W5_9MICO|nr:alpha/beta hydrolase [Promicromonospora thailandica]MCP2266210.1 Pimeloyl-ACP methyl ester carboxylesterase [Promicromonospora thailandica]BFF20692.1 alpha/beta hydrolase [Promicromonospora thailandica]